jgi:polysaccharide pyruvyl transferase WcaK-like protein
MVCSERSWRATLPGLLRARLARAKLDLLLVAGEGQLEDFSERAFGTPLTLFMWCLAARLSRTRVAFDKPSARRWQTRGVEGLGGSHRLTLGTDASATAPQ